MVVYGRKYIADRKILLAVINPWSRVERNMPVSLWGKIDVHVYVRKIGTPAPSKLQSNLETSY